MKEGEDDDNYNCNGHQGCRAMTDDFNWLKFLFPSFSLVLPHLLHGSFLTTFSLVTSSPAITSYLAAATCRHDVRLNSPETFTDTFALLDAFSLYCNEV
jgi:hypothetical protein